MAETPTKVFPLIDRDKYTIDEIETALAYLIGKIDDTPTTAVTRQDAEFYIDAALSERCRE